MTTNTHHGDTFWLSPIVNCDLCASSFGDKMYDANLPGLGWGNFCHACFTKHRGTLGIGKGQEYTRTDSPIPSRVWLCTAGNS